MKNTENEKYVKLGITGVITIVVSLLCFFILFRIQAVFNGIHIVLKILSPFIYGAVIAYILAPICNRIEGYLRKIMPKSKGLPATLSIVLAIVLSLLVVIAMIMLVVPQVVQSIIQIFAALPEQLESAMQWFHNLLTHNPELQTWWDEVSNEAFAKISSWIKTDLIPTMQNVIGGLGGQVAAFIGVIKNLFLGILISIYLLVSRKQFAAQAKLLICGIFPKQWADVIENEAHYADKMFNGFLMGKLLDSVIIGIICFAGISLLGLSSAPLISVVVGVTNIIPFFGPFIGAIPCALLLLLEKPVNCLIFLVFIVFLQQLDGNIIGPKILGNTTGLSSFWVLFSILLFGGLWGVLGMIVGVPLFAVIYDIIRQLTCLGLKRHEREDLLATYNTQNAERKDK